MGMKDVCIMIVFLYCNLQSRYEAWYIFFVSTDILIPSLVSILEIVFRLLASILWVPVTFFNRIFAPIIVADYLPFVTQVEIAESLSLLMASPFLIQVGSAVTA